ncbi:MAG: hypothetical protein HC893_09125 [Chloroflexaceae bacterium]|nr:hypothetical protein [Chloroflexaceae bacterium]
MNGQAFSVLTDHRQRYCAAIRQARHEGTEAFQAWFNREAAHTPQQAQVRGFWDFSVHILTPTVCRLLSRPENRIVARNWLWWGPPAACRLPLFSSCDWYRHPRRSRCCS